MGKLVAMANEVHDIGLRALKDVELNFFWALTSEILDKGGRELTFTRQQISEMSGYDLLNRSAATWRKDIRSMNKKLMALNTGLIDPKDGAEVMFVLFPLFKIYDDRLTIQVSEYFRPWFNDLFKRGKFTAVELKNLLRLKRGYLQLFYFHLMQEKAYGEWKVSVEDFRKLMQIPDSQKTGDIDRLIIKPAIQQLTTVDDFGNKILESLEVEKIKGGYRNLKLVAYHFKFKDPDFTVELPEGERLTKAKYNLDRRKRKAQKKVGEIGPKPEWLGKPQEIAKTAELPTAGDPLLSFQQAKEARDKDLEQLAAEEKARKKRENAEQAAKYGFNVQKHENGGMTFTKKPAPEPVEVPEEDFEDYSQYDEGRLNPYLQAVTTKEAIAKEFDEGGKRK